MSKIYRGKGIFKPLNTGWIDEHTAAVREWIANVFFYRKDEQVLMIDAGYNYDRLEEKMQWLDLNPSMIHEILITHQDTDHVGAVEQDSPGLFQDAKLYFGEIENRHLMKNWRTGWTTLKQNLSGGALSIWNASCWIIRPRRAVKSGFTRSSWDLTTM